jgi:hypothetical protein
MCGGALVVVVVVVVVAAGAEGHGGRLVGPRCPMDLAFF